MFAKGWFLDSCYDALLSSSPNKPQYDVGDTVRVNVQLEPTEACERAKTGNTLSSPVDGAYVELQLIGPASWTDASSVFNPTGAPNPTLRSTSTCAIVPSNTLTWAGVQNSSAWAEFRVTGKGPIAVQANYLETDERKSPSTKQGGDPTIQQSIFGGLGDYIFFNSDTASGSVATLTLTPAKAYRHIKDAITLKVVALNANGARASNVPVVFAVHADCDYRTTQPQTVVTNAAGEASFQVVADEPGVVTVVAASSLGENGAPVLSKPSTVFFFVEHKHREERERQYYERWAG